MPATEFIWTAVPGGTDPGDPDTLLLNVHVGIKLTQVGGDNNRLDDHPEFFHPSSGDVHWPPVGPAAAGPTPDMTFDVTIDDGFASSTTFPGIPVDTGAYDRAYWAAVFAADTRVEDFQRRDLSAKRIRTYPAAKLVQTIQNVYTAAFPDGEGGYPTGQALLGTGLSNLSFRGRQGDDRYKLAQARFNQVLTANGVVDTRDPAPSGVPPETFDVFQALDYFKPQGVSAFEDGNGDPIPTADPRFTFHEALAGLHAEPVLQRLFGLVLQLRLSRRDVNVEFSGDPVIGVVVTPNSAQLGTASHRSPRTVTDYGNGTTSGLEFNPRPRPTDPIVADGYLRMEPGASLFTVSGVDPTDAIKLSTAAGSIEANSELPLSTRPAGESLPALRSGLFVTQNGLAKDFKDRFATTPASTAAIDGMSLWAEDLMKGFLVDIRRSSPDSGAVDPWRSEAFHSSTYTFDNNAALDVTVDAEEGHSSRGMTERLDGDPDLYAGEVVYPWEGFPAGLPMPGRALNSDPADPNQAVDPDTNPTGAPAGDLPFTITHGRPAGAPWTGFSRLLCGDDYEFRARVRWIDGTNLPPDDTDDSHSTAPFRHLRTEPVPPSDLYPTEPYVPGEGQGTLVLRGNYDTPPEKAFVERLILPKRVAFTDVLKTRLLDTVDPNDASKTIVDRSHYAELARRDGYDLAADPNTATMPTQPDQFYVDAANFVTNPLPILPDPMVAGFALHIRQGPNTGTTGRIAGGTYLNPDVFWLRMVEGDGPVNFDGDRIVVPLRKGDKITAAHSAIPNQDHSDWLALLDWVGGLTGAQQAAVNGGRHTAITPWADLTLIYAVRQPLELGELPLKIRTLRPKGSTFIGLNMDVPFSRRSTDQLDVTASWQEWEDFGPESGRPTTLLVSPGEETKEPRAVVKDAVITERIMHDDDDNDVLEIGAAPGTGRIEFGDTKHRVLELGTTVTSRYAEHFTQMQPDTHSTAGKVIQLLGVGPEGLVPGWVTVRVPRPMTDVNDPANAADRAVALTRALPKDPRNEPAWVTPLQGPDRMAYHPGHFRVNEATGEVEMLADGTFNVDDLEEVADGAELRITYLVPPITRSWPEEGDPGRELVVPSSAQPAAPVVRYVIPTFGWASNTSGGGTQVTSQRDGRGLRVYVERPWWSSGQGELLGVLLWKRAEADGGNPSIDMDQDKSLFPYVTQWGEDPLFKAGALPDRYPLSTAFTNRVATSTNLRVDGSPPGQGFPSDDDAVIAVGHEVTYDEKRDLWYTDIVLEASQSYTPFIRLALARWQPESLSGCELSPVVLAEFVQLAPDRSATVVVDSADPRNLTITLTGPGPGEELGGDQLVGPRGRVQVTVEARRPGVFADDELSWTPVSTPVLLSGSRQGNVNTFSGGVQLPATPTPQEYRIVVEEFETHLIEPTETGFVPGVGGRLVHTDTLVVTAGGPDLGTGGPPPGGGGAPGPAPEFEEPGEVIDPPEFDEFVLIEITEPDIAGPVINEIELSIGTVVIELLGVRGQGELLVGIPEPGSFPGRGGVTIGNVIDVSTSGITHEGANVTMPRGFSPSAGNSLGTRMLHLGGGLADVTTGVNGDQVSGFSPTLSPFATAEYTGLQRFAGSGRIETAAAISEGAFGAATSTVFLATAGAFPDALTAGPWAATVGAPILLVGESLPEATAAEIERLSPNEIILLGGPAAIPDDVAFALRDRFPSATIRRVAGASRFATAAAVSAEAFPVGAPVAYVATGGSFPDALCGGPAALRDGGPMLLVTPDSLPAETADELVRLGVDRVVVLGGTAAVSESVAEEIGSLTGAAVERLAGPDRYSTGAAIVDTFGSPRTVFVATGEAFPDALAGVPATGGESAAMVLVRPDAIPEVSAEQIGRLSPERIVVLGGDAAVRESLEEQLAAYLLEE